MSSDDFADWVIIAGAYIEEGFIHKGGMEFRDFSNHMLAEADGLGCPRDKIEPLLLLLYDKGKSSLISLGWTPGSEEDFLESLSEGSTTPESIVPLERSHLREIPGTLHKNSIGMEFSYIPPGEFMMGSGNSGEDERPVHRVVISSGFWMGKYQVTQGQWESVTGETIYEQRDRCIRSSKLGAGAWSLEGVGDNYPMYFVSWEEATDFVEILNQKNDGLEYSLPSEAQWEYAARAGTTTDYAFGDSIETSQANFYLWEGPAKGMAEVGTYPPNNWGICDMHGNMWEFCQDWYDADYYSNSPLVDPPGPDFGSKRVKRGGCWLAGADTLRSANRGSQSLSFRSFIHGFRVAARLARTD